MESGLGVFPLASQFLHGEGWWCCFFFELIHGANVLYTLFKKKYAYFGADEQWMVKRVAFLCLVLWNFLQAHFSRLSEKKKTQQQTTHIYFIFCE